jgi:UDP-hydrolysing UDP-N-acetyl-D-glucosamine 2-epimerase
LAFIKGEYRLMMQKIVVVSGSRADYGILKWVMKEIENTFELKVLNLDFNPLIIKDGFRTIGSTNLNLTNDSNLDIAKITGIITTKVARELSWENPDLILILGDRYEILAVATAALLLKIPIAHLCGGDITEGAFDESIRHTITKMSHIHFVTNEQSRQVVKQLGENPSYIFNVGHPGLDILDNFKPKSKEKLEDEFKFIFRDKNLLVTYHPETLDNEPIGTQFFKLLHALYCIKLNYDIGIFFTYPNADPDNQKVINLINSFTLQNSWSSTSKYLGQYNYLSFVSHCDVVVGNSSSGLYEVPSFKKPTVNIGDRQKGRLKASSVIDCKCEVQEIIDAIEKAFNLDCSNVISPYYQKNSSKKIVEILKHISDYKSLLVKHFNVL